MTTAWLGIASNIATLLLLAAVIGVLNWLTRRKKIKRFLHIKNRGVTVYASRVQVISGGAFGFDGVRRTFGNATVPESELSSIIQFEDFLSSIRPTSGFLGSPLNRIRVLWRDTTVNLRVSPTDESGIDRSSTLITLGSPGYNLVSAVIQRDFPNLARFQNGNREIAIPNIGVSDDVEAFLVVRAVNQNLGQCAFYVAGQSEMGTATAAGYLVNHWKELHKRFPVNTSFALVFAGRFQEGGQPALLFETHTC